MNVYEELISKLQDLPKDITINVSFGEPNLYSLLTKL